MGLILITAIYNAVQKISDCWAAPGMRMLPVQRVIICLQAASPENMPINIGRDAVQCGRYHGNTYDTPISYLAYLFTDRNDLVVFVPDAADMVQNITWAIRDCAYLAGAATQVCSHVTHPLQISAKPEIRENQLPYIIISTG